MAESENRFAKRPNSERATLVFVEEKDGACSTLTPVSIAPPIRYFVITLYPIRPQRTPVNGMDRLLPSAGYTKLLTSMSRYRPVWVQTQPLPAAAANVRFFWSLQPVDATQA